MKQWDLPHNSTVILPNGEEVTFLKMDGMYAKWDDKGEFKTGNFSEFETVNPEKKIFKVVN